MSNANDTLFNVLSTHFLISLNHGCSHTLKTGFTLACYLLDKDISSFPKKKTFTVIPFFFTKHLLSCYRLVSHYFHCSISVVFEQITRV